MTELTTNSVNLIATANEGGKQVLLIGLKEAYHDKPQYRRYLKREFENGKDLDCPNIFKLLDMKDTQHGTCIVTEWDDCRTLAQWIAEGHGSDEKKCVARQVAAALEYMHGMGKVHGNLNSHNVFITKRGDQARLSVVRLRYPDMMQQPQEEQKYLAPEAKDGTMELDARTDIYSLGMMLSEMGLDGEYAYVINKCHCFGRNERFGNVEEFMEALDHRHHASKTKHGTDRAIRMSRSTKPLMAAILLAAIAVGIILVLAHGHGDTTADNLPQTAQTAAADSLNVESATPQPATETTAEDDNAFLAELVPQMHSDLDRIFGSDTTLTSINRKVTTYYKGLRRELKKRKLTNQQLNAFDQAFAEYVKSKKAESL